ncbi:hypothetical protein SLS56_006504 [Neofusicoccum ribis]|uniref:Transcription factor domain-containing protein n=1 Tax=Neofusicoccum ribis TaxID=45134 RepID=A0ABR3SS42_9PEZI
MLKLEELENEISQLKALLSSRPAVDQQATPANSMSSSIPQANPFDQLIGQSTSPLQNDATIENADLLSAHLSGGSTITRSSWQELPRDFMLSQGLSGEPNATGRANFAWTDHQQVVEQGPQSEWIHNNATFTIRKTLLPDAVAGGLASHGDAEQWFQCFFEGSDRLVPVFSTSDTFQSVRERSSLLFDVILTIGCKIYGGSGSPQYQSMHRHLRQRISNYVLSSLVVSSIETIQALLVLSCYWEKSWLFMDLALWMAQELKLPDAVEQMMTRLAGEGTGNPSTPRDPSREEETLFQMARLNALRAAIHASLTAAPDHRVHAALRDARLDLALWHADWAARAGPVDRANLAVQLQWALVNAHLRALRVLGVQNVAVVTDDQRAVVLAARAAAEAHLHLLTRPGEGGAAGERVLPYLARLRWATRFVWAKLAFSVLLALRLALLLGDSVEALGRLGEEAGRVVGELRRVVEGEGDDEDGRRGVGYFGILETSVEKFRGAVAAMGARAQQGEGRVRAGGGRQQQQRAVGGPEAEADFRTYLPKEFSFDWDFPGLNLQYVPLDWEELFGNFEEML